MFYSWITIALGTWVMLSPWLLGVSGVAVIMWSNLLAGLTLIIMNLWLIYGTAETPPAEVADMPESAKNGKVGTMNGTKDK